MTNPWVPGDLFSCHVMPMAERKATEWWWAIGDNKSNSLVPTTFGAPTKIHDLLSLALSKAFHKLEAHETSLGRVLSIVFLADSIDEDDSIEEAINALEVHSYIIT